MLAQLHSERFRDCAPAAVCATLLDEGPYHCSARTMYRLLQQAIQPEALTIHGDRGSSMRSRTVALLLSGLGVTKTHSRPHVSNDNAYSESQFRTLIYRPNFPRRFGSLQDARAFAVDFFRWYNEEHRHSGISLLTPAALHSRQAPLILEQRQAVLDQAYRPHPDRFVKRPPKPRPIPAHVWINKPPTTVDNAQ